MNQSYECVRCGHSNPFAHYVRAKWDKPVADRCKRCGAVHAVLKGEATVVSRPMLPIDCMADGVVSAWMLPWTRPVVAGFYDCQFYGVAKYVRIYWNGAYFIVAPNDPRRVQMREFRTWRGVWGTA